MNRLITYTGIALSILLQGLPKPAWAQGITIPSAETNVAPAAASLSGFTYVAWKGKNTPGMVWYSSSNGPGEGGWSPQQPISFAETTQAPALAALGNYLYLAWRGESPNLTDKIFYSTYPATGCESAGWSCQISIDVETTAAPALAASASTLYMAWTTAQNTIEVASFDPANSVWTPLALQPAASPYPGTAPALAVYEGYLFLAWVQEAGTATYQVMYATLGLYSGASWSSALPTPAFSSVSVAPALGVYALGGLYLAWTPESGTVDVSGMDWDDGSGSWGTPVKVPGLPIPPGPLTPALVSNDLAVNSCTNEYSFDLVYAYPVSGETYDDIYVWPLSGPTFVGLGSCP